MLDKITPLILTLNEELNIERVLDRLRWAHDVVVVDSCSSDGTRRLLSRFTNARCIEHEFASHAAQWNYGLAETDIKTEWVLALDADYVLSEAFVEELRKLSPHPGTMGYQAGFRYCVFGKALRGTLYPPVTVLFRRHAGRYVQDGHTQRLTVDGRIEKLQSPILHDDRKPLSRWLASQCHYARLEADFIRSKSWGELGWPDRLRTLYVVMPPLAFIYCLTVGGGIRDGWPGMYYAMQRCVAEVILSLVLIERKITSSIAKRSDGS